MISASITNTCKSTCCDSCNNCDKNQRKKTKREHIDFTWFDNVLTFTRM